MTQHTVEPWKVGADAGDKQSIYAGFRVASTQSGGEYVRNAANARRIVACVNALAGIPIEAIEALPEGELARLIRERVVLKEGV